MSYDIALATKFQIFNRIHEERKDNLHKFASATVSILIS